MRPYVLQGHTRPLNHVVYNTEGDLLVTCGKDSNINLWWTDNGVRAGSFDGHNGVVWTVDMTYDSQRLLSAAGDSSARLWNMTTGEEQFRWRFNEPARACKFSVGERMAAISTDPFMNNVSAIRVFNIAEDLSEQSDEELLNLTGPRGRITRLHWVDCNRSLLSSSEDGVVRRWDVETGKCVAEAALHGKQVMDMQMSADGTHFITASSDRTSKLVDTQSFEVMKEYKSAAPINSAALSPIFNHVLIGGGQDAAAVTTTAARAGYFEARFFHKVFAEEIANVRGHFSPINSVAFSPDGTSFVTGAEEGNVRLHHFDADYFTTAWDNLIGPNVGPAGTSVLSEGPYAGTTRGTISGSGTGSGAHPLGGRKTGTSGSGSGPT
ncbi:eukaryotic translation initiation factor 3 subunit I-like [Micractinium conductrix]|uniref:Eukaryotic translation initiation factor 3 subunit I n=1 Tax=Micractinium conductrix TaxID=554055 RepID=A0A2P6V9W2_9CHLO|nr:eukaryotic translation initiation factor 3 subunit I-like [Micractinium conductrix]|eukprot:PSC70882.1 eukaryotic translation initiation factor 3 subunit I-like [Micractinium conductrix]